MGKTKIHELAKELNITSKELLEKAKELGIDAKSHMSSIEEDEANKLKAQYSNKNKADKSKTEKAVKKEDKKQSPVIIRLLRFLCKFGAHLVPTSQILSSLISFHCLRCGRSN